ncbi:hypothetical protein, partial [Gardnerella vaginalis]|uniref:hypothetical protein n=1 Tax=Gardnerella vaginalis TaxID=2702 RepID=UPI001E50EABA
LLLNIFLYSHMHIRTLSNCNINQPQYTHHKILYRILQHIPLVASQTYTVCNHDMNSSPTIQHQ